VATYPEPVALFVGFGESSLDFVLRVWSVDAGWPGTSSKVAVAINRALTEAGIEIPFPQRDVHLRGGEAPPR
jgi:small-conductance mechanosensitive channel